MESFFKLNISKPNTYTHITEHWLIYLVFKIFNTENGPTPAWVIEQFLSLDDAINKKEYLTQRSGNKDC